MPLHSSDPQILIMPWQWHNDSVCFLAIFRWSSAVHAAAAKRFKKQIFLSVDLPASIVGFGQGRQLLLEAERGIVETLKGLENS